MFLAQFKKLGLEFAGQRSKSNLAFLEEVLVSAFNFALGLFKGDGSREQCRSVRAPFDWLNLQLCTTRPIYSRDFRKLRNNLLLTEPHCSRERSPHKKPRAKLKSAVIHEVNQRDQAMCQAKLADGTACGQKRWLHVHHIKPVSEGGTDTTENLITLCSSHHRIWHSK